jgi:hypothetical protein
MVTVGPKPHEEAALEPGPSLGRVGDDAQQQEAGVQLVHPSAPLAEVCQWFSVSRRVASRRSVSSALGCEAMNMLAPPTLHRCHQVFQGFSGWRIVRACRAAARSGPRSPPPRRPSSRCSSRGRLRAPVRGPSRRPSPRRYRAPRWRPTLSSRRAPPRRSGRPPLVGVTHGVSSVQQWALDPGDARDRRCRSPARLSGYPLGSRDLGADRSSATAGRGVHALRLWPRSSRGRSETVAATATRAGRRRGDPCRRRECLLLSTRCPSDRRRGDPRRSTPSRTACPTTGGNGRLAQR